MLMDLDGSRWGCNEQPFREEIEYVLQKLPIEVAVAKEDKLYLKFLRLLRDFTRM